MTITEFSETMPRLYGVAFEQADEMQWAGSLSDDLIDKIKDSEFGAFVVRNGGQEFEDTFRTFLETETPSDRKAQGLGHGEHVGPDLSVHSDPYESHFAHRVTSNHMVQGQAQALVLVGSTMLTWDSTSKAIATGFLFDYRIADMQVVTPPKRVLQAYLRAEDVILFNHSLPHAFRSLTPDRYSRSTYM